ncbi:methane monooxygenase/ammonia monooxygenase subunit B, partial [Myxococcota bacterium]|nr:methane monooxygenase/ammonia monooxygenase subunit B [Myxococcota bacterium]
KVGVPGPVFLRKDTYLNGKLMLNSTSVEIGGHNELKINIKARKPGTYHVHPMLNIQSAGPIVGPGKFVEVQATDTAFTNEVTTITGQTVDLENYGLANVVTWHVIWALVGIAWLIYWFRKPLFIPRMVEIQEGRGEELITSRDRWVGAGFAAFTLILVAFGYFRAEMIYPTTVPLQAGRSQVAAMEIVPSSIEVSVEEATYRIPGRTVNLTLRVTNNGSKPQQLGEFTTANLRFIDASLVKPTEGYPVELVEEGLQVEPSGSIQPGQTVTLKIKATNPAWETEQLALLIYDPDSRFGGLLMFYDDQGNRSIVTIGGGLIPTFI